MFYCSAIVAILKNKLLLMMQLHLSDVSQYIRQHLSQDAITGVSKPGSAQ